MTKISPEKTTPQIKEILGRLLNVRTKDTEG